MKTKLRRLTAMVLAVSMVASMIGIIPAFAANSSSEDQIAQGGGDYFYYAQDGFLSTTYDGLGGVSWNTPTPVTDPVVTAADGAVEISKTISPTNVENQFEIELMVKTTEELEKLEVGEDAAVVLVMDVSGSMLYNMEGTMDSATGKLVEGSNTDTNTRIYAAKAAATNFIESFADNATATSSRMATIVTFTGDENPADDVLHIDDGIATVSTGWTDVNASETTYDKFVDAIDDISIMTATEAEEYDYNVRETNIYAGLAVAYDQLDEIKNSGIENVYVILLSDGSPDEPIANQDEMQALQASYNSNEGFTDAFGNTYRPDDYDDTNSSGLNQAIAANAAAAIKDHSTNPTLYTVGFATDSTQNTWLANSIASSSSAAFTSDDASELTAQFDIIASEIKKAAEAWTVTDPMGTNIILTSKNLDDNTNSVSVDADDTIHWKLYDSKYEKTIGTEGSVTTTYFTYTLNYTIELDTDAQGFSENVYYLTNGATYLEYYLTESSGTTEGTAYFLVPAVTGDLPEYDYTIEYYQKNASTGEYVKQSSSSSASTKNIDMWTVITLPTDANNKYDNYNFTSSGLYTEDGDAATYAMTITEDDMVLKLYYDPIPTTVTVNHYTKTGTYDANGIVVWPDDYTLVDTDPYSTGLYVGDTFTVTSDMQNSNHGTFVESNVEKIESLAANTIDADGNTVTSNIVNLYYEKITGDAKSATVNVYETWETLEYDLVNGVYETVATEVISTTGPTLDSTEVLNYLGTHTVNLPDYSETTDGVRVSVKMNNSAMTILEGDTVTVNATTDNGIYDIYIVYQTVTDNRGDEITVDVDHYYTRNETIIENGAQADGTSFLNEKGSTVSYTGYAAETLTIAQYTSYKSETYTSDSSNDGKITTYDTYGDANNADIDLYYSLTIVPATANVTVTHIFYTLDPVVDPEDGEVTWVRQSTADYTDEVTYPTDGTAMYVNQVMTAPLNPESRTGYSYIGTDEARVITLTADSSDDITLVYEKKSGEEPEVDSVSLIHRYYVDVETVKDGVVVTERRFVSESDPETVYGVSGETYTGFEEDTTYGDRFDEVGEDLTATYGGSDIVLKYVKDGESELKDATLTVDHDYFTQTMTVEDGVAAYYDAAVLDGTEYTLIITDKNGNTLNASELYAGMEVTVEAVPTYGEVTYTASTANPALTITLVEGENTLSLDYSRQVALDTVDVYVTDTYNLTTYSYDGEGGESSSLSTTYGRTASDVYATKYVGESVEITTAANGYTLSTVKIDDESVEATNSAYVITVTEDTQVDLVYSNSTGKGTATSVTVYHYYTQYDKGVIYSGYGIDENYQPETQTINSFVGQKYTATPNYKYNDGGTNGYDLVDSDATPDFDSGYTITLVANDENEIHLYYTKDIENCVPVTVTITHTYATYDTYLGEYVNVGDDAALYQSITYVNGLDEDGNWEAWIGMEYTADEISVADYDLQTAVEDMTLTLVATDNTINLYYERTIDTTPSTPSTTYYTLTVSYVDEDGNEIADGSSSRKAKGNSYSTTEKSIDGYTFLEMDATSDAASGTMNSSKDVIYVYTADVVVDIPEEDTPLSETPEIEEEIVVEIPVEDVPLADIPEIEVEVEIPETDIPLVEIPVEEVPLSDIPQTGDNRNLAFLVGIASFSAIGLAVLVKVELDDKKKRTSK